MASIAAGKRTGIAPNADLFLVKTKGHWNPGTERENQEGRVVRSEDKALNVQPRALEDIVLRIRSHIEERLKSDPSAKSVINMSWGMSRAHIHPST
jgi:hypothetical protein